MVIRGEKMRHSNNDEYTNLDYLKDVNDRIYEQLSYAEAKHAVFVQRTRVRNVPQCARNHLVALLSHLDEIVDVQKIGMPEIGLISECIGITLVEEACS